MNLDRGRLTPVDVVVFLAVLAVLAALGPVFLNLMDQNLYQANPATAWMVRLIMPVILLTLLAFIYVNAAQGVR